MNSSQLRVGLDGRYLGGGFWIGLNISLREFVIGKLKVALP